MRRLVMLVLVMALFGVACDEGEPTNGLTTTTAATPTTVAPTTTMPPAAGGLVVYALTDLAGEPGPYLIPVARQDTPATGPGTAVEMLLLGLTFTETGYGLSTAIPPELSLRAASIDADGVVTVDLPAAFGSDGGTTMMEARLAQLVATVLQFPDATGVELALDGSRVDVFSSEGLILDDPMTMASIAAMIPPVLVTSPPWGAEVTVPFHVRGEAATASSVAWSLVDWDGRIMIEGAVGVVDRTFEFDVAPAAELIDPEAPPYQHTLIVWQSDGGGQDHVIEYVLTLRT